MAFKSFIAPAPPEQVEFELGGTYTTPDEHDEPTWVERFKCVPTVPLAVLRSVMGATDVNENGDLKFSLEAIFEFMEGCLLNADLVRFNILMSDKERIVDIDTMGQAMMWVSEQVMDRPTGP